MHYGFGVFWTLGVVRPTRGAFLIHCITSHAVGTDRHFQRFSITFVAYGFRNNTDVSLMCDCVIFALHFVKVVHCECGGVSDAAVHRFALMHIPCIFKFTDVRVYRININCHVSNKHAGWIVFHYGALSMHSIFVDIFCFRWVMNIWCSALMQ